MWNCPENCSSSPLHDFFHSLPDFQPLLVPKPPGTEAHPRHVLEERRHLPFQVLDASAIEGIRGLAGESSSIYSCIQIYKALTPPPPRPPQRIAARRKDPGLRSMWDPLRSGPAQTSGCALPHPRPQVQVRL